MHRFLAAYVVVLYSLFVPVRLSREPHLALDKFVSGRTTAHWELD
jgi:hypothetical protein